FDPYHGFYSLEALDVENFNLLTRLIGIQKFEKKGANPGGDGGGGPDLRTLFKFVSYWNPSIVPGEDGKATVEFEVPDNLTGWRVLALAVTPSDRMGLGQGRFVVNRPTEIRPALPNQVTEGDRFDARFTVMNRTEEIRTLTVTAEVSGAAESPGLAARSIEAEPYQRYDVSFPVRTTGVGSVLFTVRASDLVDGDALRLPLQVGKKEALEVAATYGTTTEPNTTESFLFPENMRTDRGRVSVVSSPSVLGNLEGAFEYLRDYPYLCWEQKLTKAIMASHFEALRGYVREDFTWPGHEEVLETTLAIASNYQAPNGGMVFWIPEDDYASPYLSAYTA
ncbi:MAG: alpha-2-macroglobulin family protein, partial [Vicinamibacteria bacterium]